MNTFKHAQDIEAQYSAVGYSLMSDDFACKLLAYCNVHGGSDSNTVLNQAMNTGLAIASQKLNIKGGEIPNWELLTIMQRYAKELRENDKCEWLQEIADRYKIEVLGFIPTGTEVIKKKKTKNGN